MRISCRASATTPRNCVTHADLCILSTCATNRSACTTSPSRRSLVQSAVAATSCSVFNLLQWKHTVYETCSWITSNCVGELLTVSAMPESYHSSKFKIKTSTHTLCAEAGCTLSQISADAYSNKFCISIRSLRQRSMTIQREYYRRAIKYSNQSDSAGYAVSWHIPYRNKKLYWRSPTAMID